MERLAYSVIIPLYNEKESAPLLHKELISVFDALGKPYELIFVDDGSSDGTSDVLRGIKPLLLLRLKRNAGQTAALGVGVRESRGEVIITLDGDLENRPSDIPRLLAKLDEGYDIVSGWRKDRWKGKLFTRRIPSAIANRLISLVTRVHLHDHGCTLKIYRREILEGLHFTGDMHRMIVAYAKREGARVAEMPVAFESRKFGTSKYGISRTFKVLLDVLAFHFFYKYARRPMHFFGAVGFASFLLGAVAGMWALWLKVFEDTHFIRTPLPILAAVCILIGFQFILMGLIAEIINRSDPTVPKYDREA